MTSKILVHRYTSVENFREDPFSSFYAKLLTDRETDERRVLHSFIGKVRVLIKLKMDRSENGFLQCKSIQENNSNAEYQ